MGGVFTQAGPEGDFEVQPSTERLQNFPNAPDLPLLTGYPAIWPWLWGPNAIRSEAARIHGTARRYGSRFVVAGRVGPTTRPHTAHRRAHERSNRNRPAGRCRRVRASAATVRLDRGTQRGDRYPMGQR